jgi:gliding motility associated protien GldN
MKRVAGLLMLGMAIAMVSPVDSLAQAKKKKKATARKTNTNRNVLPAQPEPAPVVNLVDSVALNALNDSIARAGMIPAPLVSRRPGTTVVGNLVDEKTPLAYDNLRVDDQVYKQIVWKDLSVAEKINATFRYAGEDDNGSQNFFYILLQHIRDGDLTAFDAVNDRFTTPLNIGEVSKSMGTSTSSMDVPDIEKDPTGTLGIMKTVTITEEFNINAIIGYRIKEEIIFDRETSRMHFRTLGIAPLMEKDIAGQKVSIPMFWVYYPDARPFLAKHEAYNPKNMAMRMSWEEIFESRYYAGNIYKSTVNNSGDLPLRAIIKDPLLRLYEGETIKDNIFNWEQDQWSY